MHEFSRERQPLHCDVIVGKAMPDSVSCTNYFMSIHNLRYSVQLIKIATRNKKSLKEFQDFGASNNSVRVIIIVLRMPSWPLRSLHCDANDFVSAVTRSGQIEQV